MNQPAKSHSRTVRLVQLAVLTAIIILMQFTPIGYLKIGLIEMTFIVIPVVVGAIVLGPGAGAFLGAVFGATSFIQCFGSSPFGVALLGINPFLTALLCFIPRILLGWLSGLLFKSLYRLDRSRSWSFAVSSLAGSLINTVGFVGLTVAFFWRTDYIQGLTSQLGASGILTFAVAFVGLNGLIEAVVCTLVGTLVSRALARYIRHTAPQIKA